jgi:uncharacterized protein YecT (DUF1311 family)
VATFPKDIDGDGTPDIATTDERFAGAFADGAGARQPPRFIDVVGGATVDVSSQPRFAAQFRRDLRAAEAGCLKHGNGACAAMVADAARLSLRDWAWRAMLANYDGGVIRTWPTLCRIVAPPGQCPADQQQSFSTMPEALAGFLVAAGYVSAEAPPPPTETTLPDFDCATADQPVTLLICNTPSLSQDDHAMAQAYAQAQAAAADPVALRNDQRQWLDRRSRSAADVDALHGLYQERINALQSEGE